MGKQNYGLRPSLLGKPNQGHFGYVTVNRQRNVGHTRAESLCRRKWSVVAGMVWAGKGRIVLRPSPDEGRRLDQVESYMLWGKPQNTWVNSKFLVS